MVFIARILRVVPLVFLAVRCCLQRRVLRGSYGTRVSLGTTVGPWEVQCDEVNYTFSSDSVAKMFCGGLLFWLMVKFSLGRKLLITVHI